MSLQDRINAIAAAEDFGAASAVKRGRTPALPYVPVIKHVSGRRHWTENPTHRAYATRDEAIAVAQECIDTRRDHLRLRLAMPNGRAMRVQYGLPKEL